MPEIVNMDDNKKSAFARGFWKGMAAPLMLFSAFDASSQPIEHTFRPLPKRVSGAASDWVNVGNALRAAAKKDRESGGR